MQEQRRAEPKQGDLPDQTPEDRKTATHNLTQVKCSLVGNWWVSFLKISCVSMVMYKKICTRGIFYAVEGSAVPWKFQKHADTHIYICKGKTIEQSMKNGDPPWPRGYRIEKFCEVRQYQTDVDTKLFPGFCQGPVHLWNPPYPWGYRR